ncbi:hypothetical protein JCM10908_002562 [Rhodotorula pacifica]|uniref:uncharacterized protein n=1 Tax=Rhodotorula pacifica TaxID=1495444 RepID=UPI0031777D52
MSRFACTAALLTFALLQLVAAVPLREAATSIEARYAREARAASASSLLRRAADSASSSNGSTSASQGLLDIVAAAISKLSQAKAAKTAGLSTNRRSYSALVAFGASYTDNAHERSNADKGSLRNYAPYSSYGGRYCNGPVAVEYMVQSDLSPALPQGSNGVKLIDYAFGGSVISNGLDGTGTAYPATDNQVASFVADLKGGSISIGSGRVLYYFNTGINPVMSIFHNFLQAGGDSNAFGYAQKAVADNANALIKDIRSINTDSTVQSKNNGRDFLIVGIPQMDITPVAHNSIPSSYNQRQKNTALSQLQTLTNQYNSALASFAKTFTSEISGGNAYFFDLASLWQSLTNSGPTYGITQGTKVCLSGSTLCNNPNQYLYLDTLHPVTSVHKLWAQQMNALVVGSSS